MVILIFQFFTNMKIKINIYFFFLIFNFIFLFINLILKYFNIEINNKKYSIILPNFKNVDLILQEKLSSKLLII